MCHIAVARRNPTRAAAILALACILAPPAGVIDSNPSNNTATDVDVVMRQTFLPLVMKGLWIPAPHVQSMPCAAGRLVHCRPSSGPELCL